MKTFIEKNEGENVEPMDIELEQEPERGRTADEAESENSNRQSGVYLISFSFFVFHVLVSI